MRVICASGEVLSGPDTAARTTASLREAIHEESSKLGNNRQQSEGFEPTQNKQTSSPDSPARTVALDKEAGKVLKCCRRFFQMYFNMSLKTKQFFFLLRQQKTKQCK